MYNRDRPFHPKRLHDLLDTNFMLDIVNPEDHAGHMHGEEHEGEEDEGEEEEEEDEDQEDDETDEQYEVRLNEAKDKLKKDRDEGEGKKTHGVFKHLFRSKGFIWLSNRPNLFFEWSQAAINNNISVGGPWVCTLKEKSLEEQCLEKDIGDRGQNLVFIGQEMKQYKDQITEAMDKCLVTEEEWSEMLKTRMTQEVQDDPFKEGVFPEDQGN